MRLGFPKSGRQTGARARRLLAIAALLLVAISTPGPRLGAKGQAQSASMRSRSVSSLPFATADGSGAMLLELFPDTVLTVDRDRVERTGPRRVVWRGHVRGLDDASVVTLATVDGVTVGEITVQDDRYRIRPRPDGYVIEQLGRMRNRAAEQWTAKLTVLKEVIEHHVSEEERDGFGYIRSECESEEIDKMADQFERAKEKLLA